MSDSAQAAAASPESRRVRLDQAVRSALAEVESLAQSQMHGPEAAEQETRELHRVGCALYESLTGLSPSEAAAAAANTADDTCMQEDTADGHNGAVSSSDGDAAIDESNGSG